MRPKVPQHWWVRKLAGGLVRDWLLLAIAFGVLLLSMNDMLRNRVAVFFNIPWNDSGISAALGAIRRQFTQGLISGVALVLSLPLVCWASSATRFSLIMFLSLVFVPDTAVAAHIFVNCRSLADEAGIPVAWLEDRGAAHHAVRMQTYFISMACMCAYGIWTSHRDRQRAKGQQSSNPHLEQLSLSGSNITDAGLEEIGRMSRLRALWLGDTAITDAGLVHLSGLHNLEELHLQGTAVTDAGLMHLSELHALRELDVRRTSVTAAGVAALKDTLPLVRVSR